MNKKDLTERDICSKFIGPAVKRAGWDGMMQIREEVAFTKGRIIVRGKLVTRGKAKRADYILYYKPNIPIAIIEAKDNNHSIGDGMQQALDYAVTLNIPFVFSSNGDGFVFHDRTGASMEKEATLSLDAFIPHMLCVTNLLLHGIENPSFVRHDNTLARPYISYTQSDRVDIVLTNPPFGGREEDGIESNFPKHFQTRETADLFLALIIRILKVGGRAAVVLPDGSLFGEGVKTRLKEHLMEECNLHTIVRLPNSVFKPYASIGTNLLFFEKGEPTKEIWFYEHRVPEGQKAYSMTRPIRVEHLKPCVDWWGGAKRRGRVETEVAWKVTADEVKARGYNLDVKNPHTVADDHDDPEELLAKLHEAEDQANTLRDQLKTILAEALLR
jgi:N-6 DNA Methylase/Type I restriction enzyme R protein N terminus (HSDR_N)